jgi:hypothetical protein
VTGRVGVTVVVGVTGVVEVTGDVVVTVAATTELAVFVAGGDTGGALGACVVLGVVAVVGLGVSPGLVTVGLPRDDTEDVAPAGSLASLPPPQAASAIVASIEAETLAYIMIGTGRLVEFVGGIPIPGAKERGSCRVC